jgi:hypothetical protein
VVVHNLFKDLTLEQSILELLKNRPKRLWIKRTRARYLRWTEDKDYNNRLKEIVKTKCKEHYGVSCELLFDKDPMYESFDIIINLDD